jgi:hypothetical protein
MIEITRRGSTLVVKVTAAYPLTNTVFETTWEAGAEWSASLLQNHLRTLMDTRIREIRQEEYERGWKDARSHKVKKNDWFSSSWKTSV